MATEKRKSRGTRPAPSRRRPPPSMDDEPDRDGGRFAGPVSGGRRRPKPKTRRPPDVLTDTEVRALIAACGEYTMH